MTGTTDRDYLYKPTEFRYLVLLCCSVDTPAVRLFDAEEDALDFIKNNPPYPSKAKHLNSPDVNNAYRVLGADVGGVYGYELITLTNGQPIERRLYWWGNSTNETTWTPDDNWYVDAFDQVRELPDDCDDV